MAVGCPICLAAARHIHDRDYGDKRDLECPRCGHHAISGSAAGIAEFNSDRLDPADRARISRQILLRSSQEAPLQLTADGVEEFRQVALPLPDDQVRNLLSEVTRRAGDDQFATVDWDDASTEAAASIIGAVDRQAALNMIDAAVADGILQPMIDAGSAAAHRAWAPSHFNRT